VVTVAVSVKCLVMQWPTRVHCAMEEDIIHLSTTMPILVLGIVEPPV